MILFAMVMINILFLAVCSYEIHEMIGEVHWSHKYNKLDTRKSVLTSRVVRLAKGYLMNKLDAMINAAIANQSNTIDSIIDSKIDQILAEKVAERIVALSHKPAPVAPIAPVKPVITTAIQDTTVTTETIPDSSGRFPYTQSEHTNKIVTWTNSDSGRTVRAIILGDSVKKGSVVVRRLSKKNSPFAMSFPKSLEQLTFEGQAQETPAVPAPIKTDTPVKKRVTSTENPIDTIKTLNSLGRKFNVAWKKPDGSYLKNGVSTVIVRSTSEKFQSILNGTHPRLSLGFIPVVYN